MYSPSIAPDKSSTFSLKTSPEFKSVTLAESVPAGTASSGTCIITPRPVSVSSSHFTS